MKPASLLFAVCCAIGLACSTADNSLRIDPVGPDPKDFGVVTQALAYRCGSLDCHGTPYRNLRIYGYGALRLDPSHTPETPQAPTADEVQATYEGVVALQPDLMREVTLAKGQGLEHLMLVRKGRGDEAHKAGLRMAPGDDADNCVISWLRGAVDVEACKRVPTQF